jgi:predicted dehydrogenase
MREVRYGMIGGGEGAFIGAAHRAAARLTGHIALVAGALSSDPARARRSGAAIGLVPERSYGSYREMFAAERELPPQRRMEFVTIVAPNHVHAPAAIAAMEAGFHVLTDKPLADTLESAQRMSDAVTRTGRLLGVTHTYTGYPMIKQVRALVACGALGAVRRVHVSYTQDWLSRAADTTANKQAAWRTDPARSGEAGAFGDIGTHAFNLIEYITGDRVTRLCAELRAVVPGRELDDDGAALFHLSRGGAGTLSASQVCTGDINALTVSIYCEEAGVHWRQEEPNTLQVKHRDKPAEIWTAGTNRPYLSAEAIAATRLPAGHPEGYLEAFANIYQSFADDVRSGTASATPGYATMEDGVAAMRFIRAARRSSEGGAVWIDLAGAEEHAT